MDSAFWALDARINYLNHGSFGACPRPVLAHQAALRAQLEAEPVRFFLREYVPLLDAARRRLADFVGADPEGMVAVTNATEGVNTALRALPLAAGDEILITDQGYGACNNAAAFVAEQVGARVVSAALPFPLESLDEAVDAIVGAVTARTRIAIIDHVTSPTALVLPVERIVPELVARGVEVIVDGAHAPGMVPLSIGSLGAAFYTGNCHKWVCAPKGAAFLWTREDLRIRTRPTVISHGASVPDLGRSRYWHEFDWKGTHDPSPFLSIPKALDAIEGRIEGGWDAVRVQNRAKALAARDVLCEALQVAPPAPDEAIGSMFSVPLPDGEPFEATHFWAAPPLHDNLLDHHGIEVPIVFWPSPPKRLIRVSAQMYNRAEDYDSLVEALKTELS